MQRHPYQTSEEWRIPPPSRNMGCCSASILTATLMLSAMEQVNPQEFMERGGGTLEGSGLLSPREIIGVSAGEISRHFLLMAEYCNNAGVTREDYEEYSDKIKSVTSIEDAKTKAMEIIRSFGGKLADSANQGNCK